ncbi:MAG: sterol desaturase family protein [Pseudomonadales bacterium]|nr:sterol desaturase family protein [Pseudomonadales bacterium]
MNDLLSHWDALLIATTFFALVLVEGLSGLFQNQKKHSRHWWIDFISLAQVALLIKPAIFLLASLGLGLLLTDYQNALTDMPFWLGFLLVFLPDDFTHYWYHRLAHENDWMWPWHRTHHSTPTYQTSIAFRENWAWFWFMPGIWWSAAMFYFGLVEQVVLSTAIIGLHNTLIHNGFTFDTKLYNRPIIGKLIKAFEHIIQTPSLHRGHHGLGRNGVPMGNYGQTLFIWDVIFGTAKFIGGKIPEKYGVIKGGEEPWYTQLWAPYGYRKTINPQTIAE